MVSELDVYIIYCIALVGVLVFHLQLRAVCMSASKSMGEYVSTAALMYKSTSSSALLSFDKQKPHFEGITYTIPQNLQYFRYNFGNTLSSYSLSFGYSFACFCRFVHDRNDASSHI
jgi:hypothetical protein